MAKAKRGRLDVLQNHSQITEDKRLFCRFALNDVPVRLKDLKIGEKGSAVCKDIGGGGASVECAQELKVRTPLEMWFDLADGFEPMHLLGKVVWTRLLNASWRVGVAFDKPRLMSLARILRLETVENT